MGDPNPQQPTEVPSPGIATNHPEYTNQSLHGGVNLFLHGRLISDVEATGLTNVNIATPGSRQKLPSPVTVVTTDETTIPNGFFTLHTEVGDVILMVCNGEFSTFDGLNWVEIEGYDLGSVVVPSSTNRILAAQWQDKMWLTDGVSNHDYWIFDGITILDAQILGPDNQPLREATEFIVHGGRFWIAKGTQLYFSDLYPTIDPIHPVVTVQSLPLNFPTGLGNRIVKLLPIKSNDGSGQANSILVFKSDGNRGSVQSLFLVDNNPDNFAIWPISDSVSVISPQVINRLGYNYDADILFLTTDGLRTLTSIAPTKLVDLPGGTGSAFYRPTTYPPVSQYIGPLLAQTDFGASDDFHACFANDRFVMWTRSSGSDIADQAYVYDIRTPRASVMNGWMPATMMPAFSNAQAAFGSASTQTYITNFNADGVLRIQRIFAEIDTTTKYEEIGKRISFGEFTREKTLMKLTVILGEFNEGPIDVSLQYETGQEIFAGTANYQVNVLTLAFDLPAILETGTIKPFSFDLRYNDKGQPFIRALDFRVVMRSTGRPHILGYALQVHLEKDRWLSLDSSVSIVVTAPVLAVPETFDTEVF